MDWAGNTCDYKILQTKKGVDKSGNRLYKNSASSKEQIFAASQSTGGHEYGLHTY